MSYQTRPRHPITGRRIRLHARSAVELGAYKHRLDSLRTDMKLGLKSVEQVEKELRHLQHGPATVERAAVGYLERPSLAENTKRRVRALVQSANGGAHLAPLLGVPLAALDASVLSPWIEGLHKAGLHPTTIAMIWRTLRSLVRHGAERGWIGALPWGAWRPRLSKAPKRPQREAARTLEELARLLLAARELDARAARPRALGDRGAASHRGQTARGLLGLRQGELAGLRWSDVEWRPPITVLIARQYARAPLKMGAQPKRIESIEELRTILLRHQERLAIAGLWTPCGPIFPAPASLEEGRARPYLAGPVLSRLNLRAAMRRAQLPNVGAWSAHSLRDSFVTLEALASGGDLAHVAARSRHGSLASLARYLRALSRNNAAPAIPSLAGSIAGAAPALEEHHAKETPP